MYAPICKASDDKIELFYKDLKKARDSVKKHDINIGLGDFNAKVGKGLRKDLFGGYGLGALRGD